MKIKENNFEAPGIGSINYGQQYGTFSSPEVSQNSANFAHSNNNKTVEQNSNTRQDTPDAASMSKDLNAIYSKKDTPSPDEIITGIKYEMSQQIKTDKQKAKETVLANLKKDPHYYRNLKMLNIDDGSMVQNMSENKHPNDGPLRDKVTADTSETKKIFEDMIKQKDNRYDVNSQIVDVMKEMWKQKRQRSAWKNAQ